MRLEDKARVFVVVPFLVGRDGIQRLPKKESPSGDGL